MGYTLPFLLGARVLREGKTETSLDEGQALLDEMFDARTPTDALQLTWCHDLDAPVFGLNKVPIDGLTIRSTHTQQPSVVVIQKIVNLWGDSADQLSSALLDHSRPAIESGHFSRTFQSWQSFSRDEQIRIKNLLIEE